MKQFEKTHNNYVHKTLNAYFLILKQKYMYITRYKIINLFVSIIIQSTHISNTKVDVLVELMSNKFWKLPNNVKQIEKKVKLIKHIVTKQIVGLLVWTYQCKSFNWHPSESKVQQML